MKEGVKGKDGVKVLVDRPRSNDGENKFDFEKILDFEKVSEMMFTKEGENGADFVN